MANILIVEDDESLQRIYNFTFQKSGFNVTLASSGAEALIRVEEQSFDVILLDMLMNGMSGLDFLRAYDIPRKSPTTKVIALSNIDSPRVMVEAQQLGVTSYLSKTTYEPDQLVAYVNDLLAQPEPATEPHA